MNTANVDPRRCPLCGESNACGSVDGAESCWCYEATIPAEVLARVPAAAQGVACVCACCATGRRGSAETRATIDRLVRRR